MSAPCSVKGCDRESVTRGMCQRHYMATLRAESEPLRARERASNAARHRALWRLKDLHPDEFERLYIDEMTQARAQRRAG